VVETGASPEVTWLDIDARRIRLVHLRRCRRLAGLPEPEPGTRYVVSQLTARTVRHRRDLAFPLTEIRDPDSVIGPAGLGTYHPAPALRGWYTDWRAKAAQRPPGEPSTWRWLTGVRLTGLLFAIGTALLGGAAGLIPVMLDDATTNGWAAAGQAWTDWLTLVFLVAGVAALAAAARRWLTHMRRLAQRGTAYIIDEQAIHWLYEERAALLATISEEFPTTLRVPGPEALGERWRWQADAGGAPLWNYRTDQLVRSFWAVHYNDQNASRNGVFIWAPWPVAMAFGARATSRRRGLALNVRQRPSYGAAGNRSQLRLEDGAHDFHHSPGLPPPEAAAPRHDLMQRDGRLTVVITSLSRLDPGSPSTAHSRPPGEQRDDPAPAAPAGAGPRLLLLVVRLVRQEVGPIPLDTGRAGEISVHISPTLSGSVIPEGTREIPVAEWRLTAGDHSQVPWAAFPSVAQSIADWVEQQAAAHPGHVILLAARMPQEIAVGLGIHAGQRAASWPGQIYPVHYTGDRLTVPDLDLGRGSIPGERQ
jgi:hypothetical protein